MSARADLLASWYGEEKRDVWRGDSTSAFGTQLVRRKSGSLRFIAIWKRDAGSDFPV
jgi:hypothetical protein